MSHHRAILLFCVALILSAACNLSGLPSDAVEDGIVPVGTDLPPTSRPADSEADSCLVGEWWMDTPDLDLLVATLVPIPNIRVPDGNLLLRFYADGTFSYQGSPVIRIELGASQYIEGAGVFTTNGTYATEGGTTVLLNTTRSESGVTVWHAYKDGQSSDYPAGPQISLALPGSAPYRCTSTRLELDTRNPSGVTVTMFFHE